LKIYGLVGEKLDHSWSSKYFEDKFARLKRTDCTYQNFPLSDISQLPRMVAENPGISGLNVTIPYKRPVIPFLNDLDPVARETGAVNCIRVARAEGIIKLKGFNTDSMAFEMSLRPVLTSKIRKALVLGTGGAASAVCLALRHLSIDYNLVSRNPTEGIYTYQDLNSGSLEEYQLIINATPAGMSGEYKRPALNFPYDAITPDHILYDLVYNPPVTVFLKEGSARGARTMNGHEMLVLQAEMSWEIWNS
jgi:shikimate dehydrogenase